MPLELLRESVNGIDRLMEGEHFVLDRETRHFITFPENVFLLLQEKAVVAIFAFLYVCHEIASAHSGTTPLSRTLVYHCCAL